ncbi:MULTISPECIES: DUF262 domain-containing protein [unclassified Duganella]|uniref:GmrSD restriction endonuclease domain-containing protein n=1 Tax=unclassified Duganella TaxID=2636909 RepID=UPI0008902B9C|nr:MULTISPECIES: DUF262 domain-containing protein [unclassified Duganella]SDH43786.1 hypothetical protein SAMN05216320_11390 [Duganella sp. OV458]SDK58694.1 hypothetical protein SAMN05428973_11372 [Duganella sp. OV510]
MEYQHYSIRKILDSVISGEVRIPAFQRGFVWEMDRVAYLLDSIYKGYPFGSLLFWRTKNKLAVERNLGTFTLPEPMADYPIDYVLDGQQRLTSIFTVFQTELVPAENNQWSDVYFDMGANGNAQDSHFVAISGVDYDRGRYFPMNVLFDSVKYRAATQALSQEQITLLDKLQEKFKEISLPVQVLKTEDRSIVAIVFERINRLGLALDTLQLLSAWTWNEDFDLLEKFRELKEELSDFGFGGVGDDADLVLSCVAGILTGEPGPEKLLELNGADVRAQFANVENGIKGAIDFFRTQLKVNNLKLLPYPAMLIPVAVFFSEPDGKEVIYSAQTFQAIKRWFWRTCFSGRYGSQTRRTTIDDIDQMVKLKNGQPSTLDQINVVVGADYFAQNTFRVGTATSKTFVLLLANNDPKSLLSGKSIDLDKVLQRYNRSEFHHIYPRAYLRDDGIPDNRINALGNFCFLSSAENKNIGRKRPSVYIADLVGGPDREPTLASAFCAEAEFNDQFDTFLAARCERLAAFATILIG